MFIKINTKTFCIVLEESSVWKKTVNCSGLRYILGLIHYMVFMSDSLHTPFAAF